MTVTVLPQAADLFGRCFACGGEGAEQEAQCRWCGVHRSGSDFLSVECDRAALRESLRPGRVEGRFGEAWADDITMRQLALSAGLVHDPDDRTRLQGHTASPARGTLRPGNRTLPPVSVAVLTCPEDQRAAGVAWRAAAWASEVVMMVDGQPRDLPFPLPPRCRVLFRPLGDDFGAQRNAAQRAARSGWVLHLDTDETLDQEALAGLSAAIEVAERDGLGAIGFCRRNLVDGRLSSLFPDTQYRLLRKEGRFTGGVHERPAACGTWTDTLISMRGSIVHRLASDAVAARRDRYDRLGQSPERRGEAEALLTPFPLRRREEHRRHRDTPQPCAVP